jgi:predicted house-cleaning noncanonical NTP pyrophosphatase (MazG superfamily)
MEPKQRLSGRARMAVLIYRKIKKTELRLAKLEKEYEQYFVSISEDEMPLVMEIISSIDEEFEKKMEAI